MLPAAAVASEDVLKLLLMIVIGGGLMALGRWSSQLGGRQLGDAPPDEPNPDAHELLPVVERAAKVWPPSAEEVAASLPFDPSLGKLRIRKFYFDKTDVVPGPEDPEVFADELNIELYNPDSNHAWWQSYFIATPQGLARLLRERSWRYLHAPDILVLPRYNLEEIRRAVVSRIVAEHDYFKGLKQEEEESL
jgi:hypothetical protein